MPIGDAKVIVSADKPFAISYLKETKGYAEMPLQLQHEITCLIQHCAVDPTD